MTPKLYYHDWNSAADEYYKYFVSVFTIEFNLA